MQSEPVSPPPMHDDMLAIGEDRLAAVLAGSPRTRRFCCGRKSMAKWTPSKLASRDRQVARPSRRRRSSTTAS